MSAQASKYYVDASGNLMDIEPQRHHMESSISNFAHRALRTICLAYRDVSASEFRKFSDDDAPNYDLVCIGIVGIQDPLRDGVVESVTAFKKAGVFVRMVMT